MQNTSSHLPPRPLSPASTSWSSAPRPPAAGEAPAAPARGRLHAFDVEAPPSPPPGTPSRAQWMIVPGTVPPWERADEEARKYNRTVVSLVAGALLGFSGLAVGLATLWPDDGTPSEGDIGTLIGITFGGIAGVPALTALGSALRNRWRHHTGLASERQHLVREQATPAQQLGRIVELGCAQALTALGVRSRIGLILELQEQARGGLCGERVAHAMAKLHHAIPWHDLSALGVLAEGLASLPERGAASPYEALYAVNTIVNERQRRLNHGTRHLDTRAHQVEQWNEVIETARKALQAGDFVPGQGRQLWVAGSGKDRHDRKSSEAGPSQST